jgi:hypothetical protein
VFALRSYLQFSEQAATLCVHLVLACLSLSHIAEVEESRSAKVRRAFCLPFVSSSKTSSLFRLECVLDVIGRAFGMDSSGKAFNTQHP